MTDDQITDEQRSIVYKELAELCLGFMERKIGQSETEVLDRLKEYLISYTEI